MFKKILLFRWTVRNWPRNRALVEAEQLARMLGSEIILFEVVPFMPFYGSPRAGDAH